MNSRSGRCPGRGSTGLALLALAVFAAVAACRASPDGEDCDELETRLDELADDPANRTCATPADCVLVGGADSCDCSRHLSAHCGGQAVSRPVPAALVEVLERARDCGGNRAACDCGPSQFECIGGLCTETSSGAACLAPHDWGEHDAANDANLELREADFSDDPEGPCDACDDPAPGPDLDPGDLVDGGDALLTRCEHVAFEPDPWLFAGDLGADPVEQTGVVRNDRAVPVEVVSLTLGGTNPFEIVSPSPDEAPFVIAAESTLSVTVRFTAPGQEADAQLNIRLADCGLYATLFGE